MIQTGIDETIPKFKERLRSNKSGKVIEQDFADVVQTVFFFLSQALCNICACTGTQSLRLVPLKETGPPCL